MSDTVSPALRTAVCDLFGVDYPIVQTGMGWVSTPELTAATANAGALGILASGTLTLAETDAAIGRTAELDLIRTRLDPGAARDRELS